MFSIIDRYIAQKFLLFFVAGLLVFVTIFLAVDFMGAFARYDVGADTLMKYYAYSLPNIVFQMIPVASLVGTVFTLVTLNRTHELVALFSVGMSLARVSTPILSLVALVSVVSFWLGDRVLPQSTQKKNYVYYVDIKKKPGLYSTVKTDKIWYRSENILFNISSLNTTEKLAEGITMYYFNESWKLVQVIKAQKVKLKGALWELSDGMVTLFTEKEDFPVSQNFETKTIAMNEDLADLENSSTSAEVMSVAELRQFIKRNKDAGLDTVRYEVDYQSKYSFAFAAFVMSLLGIPFSVKKQRSGGAFVSVGICLGLAFLYWILFSSFVTMGKHSLIPTTLAAWSPNFLGIVVAVYLLLKLRQ